MGVWGRWSCLHTLGISFAPGWYHFLVFPGTRYYLRVNHSDSDHYWASRGWVLHLRPPVLCWSVVCLLTSRVMHTCSESYPLTFYKWWSLCEWRGFFLYFVKCLTIKWRVISSNAVSLFPVTSMDSCLPSVSLCAVLAFMCRNILEFHTGWNQLSCLSEDSVSWVKEMWNVNKRPDMKGMTWGWKRRDQKPGQKIWAQHHAAVLYSKWAPWHQR